MPVGGAIRQYITWETLLGCRRTVVMTGSTTRPDLNDEQGGVGHQVPYAIWRMIASIRAARHFLYGTPSLSDSHVGNCTAMNS